MIFLINLLIKLIAMLFFKIYNLKYAHSNP